jgi:hypothetical protein
MAAGLGFKTFAVGEVLSAANVNGYLMQGVLVFANATARDAAITSPQEGQFAFTKDNDSLWYYSGSAWVASGATGDIEGVTAGVGISGGGTSGTVTVTNSMATAIDAKGDLIAGTGADTFARLAVGTNGHTLVADSAEATGLKWAAPAGGGSLNIMTPTSTANSGGSVSTTGGAVTFTTVNNVSLNGVFTSTYANYLIVISNLTGGTTNGINLRFRVSGTDSSTGYYSAGFYVLFSSSTVNGENSSNGTFFDVGAYSTTPTTGSIIYLQNPQLAVTTAMQSNATRYDAAGYRTGYHNVTTAYDGFTLIAPSNTMTGVVRVYGLSN